MQDYFKYDKIQTGASLFMKSDSDGNTDKEKRALPLGIKTIGEGIKQVTNWNHISNSIDSNKGIRFEDSQPNTLLYSVKNRIATSYEYTNRINLGVNDGIISPDVKIPLAQSITNDKQNKVSFIDSWSVSDINIVDDIAFVSYEDYSDLNREDLELGQITLYQPYRYQSSLGYDTITTNYFRDYDASLVFQNNQLPLMHKVKSIYGPTESLDINYRLSNRFATYDNTILKVEFNDPSLPKKTLYFTYGGCLRNTMTFADYPTANTIRYCNNYDLSTGERFDNTFCPVNYLNFADGDYAGEFFVVTYSTRKNILYSGGGAFGEASNINESDFVEVDDNAITTIQLSVNALLNYFQSNTQGSGTSLPDLDPQTISQIFTNIGLIEGIVYTSHSAKVTLIKLQPARKCGKVDIYVRKSGIVSGFTGNRFTSPAHSLKNHDIIKIDSALFDGEQTGAIDIHPLNGEKFVKYIDDNTFELYDDQFLESPSSANNLKSVDGIQWCCIGNVNGTFGQGWSYYKTLFSPTGRNGYMSFTNRDYSFRFASNLDLNIGPSSFITDKRISDASLNSDLTSWDRENSIKSIVLDLSEDIDIYEEIVSEFFTTGSNWFIPTLTSNKTVFGKLISEFITSIPNKIFGKSAFGVPHKGSQELYPYHSQTELGKYNTDSDSFELNSGPYLSAYDLSGPYLGNKFGCSLDVKFSHNIGDSKIYNIVVGEKGSDVSIDLFGCQANEIKIDGGVIPYSQESTNADIFSIFKQRIVPYFAPHGKVHVLTMTVDKYNRITDISHKNTIFGDGYSLLSYNGSFPFKSHYPLIYMMDQFMGPYIDFHAGIANTITYKANGIDGKIITVNEIGTVPSTTLYWYRAAIANWFGPNIYDYYSNSTINENLSTLYRDYLIPDLNRNYISTEPIFNKNRSYFGESTISSTYTAYPIIDRFGLGTNSKSQLHIVPWVDSFGKSVCIGEKTTNGNLPIFSSSTVRSNINVTQGYSYNIGFTLTSADTKSEIGQISCIILGSDYRTVKLLEINSSGSVDSYNVDNDPTQRIPDAQHYKLRTGSYAGDGINEVKSSMFLSAQKILFKDGTLIWGDQILSESKSKINILRYNYNNNSLTPIGQITKQFTTPRRSDAKFVGDGFGWNIRYNDGILVTNSMVTQNEFGQDIATLLDGSAIGSYRVDSLSVFKITNQNNAEFLQNIFPSFNAGDVSEKYTDKFLIDYQDSLLNIGNIHYDNFTLQSRTWNVRLVNSYDAIDSRVILRDPVGYSLFAIDYSYSSRFGFSTLNSSASYDISPYLYFSEIFKAGEIYYDYSDHGSFLIRDTSIFNQTSSNTLSLQNNLTVTPVFFFNIPESNIDVYGNLNITLVFDNLSRRFFETINVNNFSNRETIIDSFAFDNLLPRIVLYKKDPRQTIIPNGVIGNTTTTPTTGFVTLQDGKFVYSSTHRRITNPNDDSITWKQSVTRPPMFRGGAHDLHFYGDLSASSIKEYKATLLGAFPNLIEAIPTELLNHYYGGLITLGQLYDATYDVNTKQGLISYVSNDVINLLRDDGQDVANVSMYGTIIANTNIAPTDDNTITFTIPYSIWSQYIYQGNFLKSSKDNRPFINDFTNINHGTISSTTPSSNLSNPISGTWSQGYINDINHETYDVDNISSNKTLALGILLGTVDNVNYAASSPIGSQSADGPLFNFFRSVPDKRLNIYDYKYSYNTVLATTSIEQKSIYPVLNNLINFDFSATILDISANIESRNIDKRKMQCVFNKIAYFKYNNAVYDDVQRNILNNNLRIDRYSFGKYEFVPLPVGITRDRKLLLTEYNQPGISNHLFGQSKNPIIRVAKSNTGFSSNDKGTFNKSVQIISSDSIAGIGENINTSTYIDLNEDKVQTYNSISGVLGSAYIGANNLLGSMDILDLDYLPLYIGALKQEISATTLFIKDKSKRLETTLYVNGLQKINTPTAFSLFIGQPFIQTGITLNIEAPNFEFMSLFTYEVAPSAIMPLSITTPDIDNSLTLTFQPLGTGQIPLVVLGPVLAPSSIPLNTRGLAYSNNTFRLVTRGLDYDFGVANLIVNGVTSQNNATTLVMNRPVTDIHTLNVEGAQFVNQSFTLSFTPTIEVITTDAPLFIGTQFEAESKHTTLAIIDTERPINHQTTLYIDGFIDSANNINNGENNFNLQRNESIVDISHLPETYATTLTYNNSSTTTNSLTRVSLTSSNQFLQKTKSISATNVYLGSQNKLLESNNAAYITQISDVDNNATRAFYRDESITNFGQLNHLLKRDIYDSNGRYFVLGSKNEDIADIDIYKIVDNKNVQFISKISMGLAKVVPGTSEASDSLYGKNGITDLPFGDSFVTIRRQLKSYFSGVFSNSNIDDSLSSIVVNDLKISDFNTCAISLRVRLYYSVGTTNETKTFNVIILFKLSDLQTGTSNVTSFVGQTTYYVDHYHYYILQESGNDQSKYSAAYNLAFCQDDLYFERHNGQWGQICRLLASENYSSLQVVIDYAEHPDVQYYTNTNNSPYISDSRKKAGFGIPLKIYNEYRSDSHIMLIGAQLFDPFVFNTLTQPHNPNAIGAVYIYRLPTGSSTWNYVGAMYGKGNTSSNVIANLNNYTSSGIEDKEYCLFGFDFDYMDGNTAISEPGGSGSNEINGGKVYLFNIEGSNIALLDQYSINDISLPLGYTLNSQNNFGSYIVLIDKNTPITFSNSSAGNGLIHNLSNGSTLVASLAYTQSEYTTLNEARANIENETKPYDPVLINPSITTRSQHVLSMKRLNFGNSTRKLGLVREFRTRSDNSNFTFDLQKVFIMDVQPIGFTLFIGGPPAKNNTLTLQTLSHEILNDTLLTSIYGKEIISSGLSLVAASNFGLGDMPLHIEYVNDNATTLYISSQIQINSDEFTTNITGKDIYNINTTLWTSSAINSASGINLNTYGQNIRTNTAKLYTRGYTNATINTTLTTSGIFMDNNSASLIVTGHINRATGINTVIVGYDIINNSGMFFSTSGAILGDIYRTTPLFIGKDAYANNATSIFIDSFVVSSGSEYKAVGNTLHINARPSSVYDTFDSHSLYINGPDREYLNTDATIFISAPIPEISEDGAYIHSGYLITTITGNNDAGSFFASEKYQTLNVVGSIANASGMSLYMERPTANALGLFIKDLNPTSTITTAISGAFYGSGSTDLCVLGPTPSTGTFSLYIEQPQSNLTTLTTRGYLE
jgi:hypothetical protein